MADGFEASHVPQQSRRDKLRILSHHHHHQPNLLPVYNDPSLLHLQVPADLMTTCPASCFPSSSSVSNRSCTLPHPPPPSFENPSHHDLGCAREWVYPSPGGNFTSSSSGNSGRGLSLSLSSRVNCQGNDDDHLRNLPLELNLERERYGSVGDRGPFPLGPFTGYSLILRGSRLLKPTQKLLEELCDVGRGMFFDDKVADADSSLMEGDRQGVGSGDGCELLGKKSRLISLLDEVCRRYMQYYQQLQDVVASFECVAGLGSAAPYVNLALKTMSKHFRCLKDAIVDQLRFTSKAHKKTVNTRDEDIAWLGTNERPPDLGLRAIKNSGHLQQQSVWRPQRGLPERAVAVLRAWLFEHFLHPYPTDTDKLMLAKQTGLSRCQVSNWFINARVRLWKPMVEEIHTLETQQMQVSQVTRRDERIVTQTLNDQPPVSSSVPSSASAARLHQVPQPVAGTLGEPTTGLSTMGNEQTHYRSHVVAGESIGNATSSGVTLTLGLHHQHNMGVGMELAVETVSGGVMGFYGSQEGQLRRDVYGGHGQLLNDFVG